MKAIELEIRVDKLQSELNELFYDIRKNNYKAYEMRGKYGRREHSPWDDGNGLAGFHWEWDSEELREKEEREIEEFKEQWVYPLEERYEAVGKELEEAKEELCIAKYGYGLEEKIIIDMIHKGQEEIDELYDEIEELKDRLSELREKKGR